MRFPFPAAYCTHIPVLKAVLDVLKPNRVVELGSGLGSTPLLHASGVPFVTIEHQKPWYDKMLQKLGPRDGWDFRYVDIGMAANPRIEYSQVPPKGRQRLHGIFRRLADELGQFDCLFIDGVASTRCPAMREMHPNCNVILGHDSDAPLCGYDCNYPILQKAGFIRVMFAAMISITDVVVRSSCDYDLEAYKAAVIENTKAWLDEYGMRCFNDRMIQTKGHW